MKAIDEARVEDPILKKVAKFYKDSIKLDKIFNLSLHKYFREVSNEMKDCKDDYLKVIDDRLPPVTMISLKNEVMK